MNDEPKQKPVLIPEKLHARLKLKAVKEGRKLVVVPRETPLSLIHLRNLTALAEAGARIVPATPAWYHQPKTIEDLVDFVVARAFDQLDIDSDLIQRWTGR